MSSGGFEPNAQALQQIVDLLRGVTNPELVQQVQETIRQYQQAPEWPLYLAYIFAFESAPGGADFEGKASFATEGVQMYDESSANGGSK